MKTKPKTEAPAPLLVLPTTTDPKTIAEARKAGYVVILTDDVEKVKLITPTNELIGGDMLMSALNALVVLSDSSGRSYFTTELFRRMKAREVNPV